MNKDDHVRTKGDEGPLFRIRSFHIQGTEEVKGYIKFFTFI